MVKRVNPDIQLVGGSVRINAYIIPTICYSAGHFRHTGGIIGLSYMAVPLEIPHLMDYKGGLDEFKSLDKGIWNFTS